MDQLFSASACVMMSMFFTVLDAVQDQASATKKRKLQEQDCSEKEEHNIERISGLNFLRAFAFIPMNALCALRP